MGLRAKQSEFAEAVGLLIHFAYQQGYEITLGDAFATTGHIADSFHYKRLAIDLNLFIDGEYITDNRGYDKLGAFWKTLSPDASWGGDFTGKNKGDYNHFSWGE